MATTANVLTGLGEDARVVYKQLRDKLGVLVTDRAKPKCFTASLSGRNLGLYNWAWSSGTVRGISGSADYFVRVVPRFSVLSDPDGNAFVGTPTTENEEADKSTVFDFQPYPDGYQCDSYEVWAGTVTGSLYYQGVLEGRFNTNFEIDVTWDYSTAGSVLSAQSIGPPAFANALEIYQAEGTIDSRTFLGGGKYSNEGYAKVATTSSSPILTGGTGAESTYTVWEAITDGSFRVKLGWLENTIDYSSYFDLIDIDFTGLSDMAGVATVLQTAIRVAKGPELFCGTSYELAITSWQDITAGSLQLYVDGAVVQITAMDFSGASSHTDVAVVMQAAWRTASGGSTETVSWDSTADRFIFKVNPATPTSLNTLGYLERHSSGTGQDVSGYFDGKETSTDAVLNRKGKGDTTETVTWSTDRFIFTGSDAGYQYELGYLDTVTTTQGTDLSVASMSDSNASSNLSTYQRGQTAQRTVIGTGTNWGEWVEGMKFRGANDSSYYLVSYVYDEETLYLDADYSGSGLDGFVSYTVAPFGSQVYTSALGNPFKYSVGDIVQLPVADDDVITAIRRIGQSVAIFMKHHIWMIDGVSITSPRLISNFYGVTSDAAIISYQDGLLFFTGREFAYLRGGVVQNLDTEGRTSGIISRISSNVDYIHGARDTSNGRDICIWWMGLDGSYKHNVGVVLEPSTGNWWLRYDKDANCSGVIRNENDDAYLMTGSTYDESLSIPAFTFLHADDYMSDGASQNVVATVQGLVTSVGTATTTSGYLTCNTAGSPLASWLLIEDGYFEITIDDGLFQIGPLDFTGDTTFDEVAASIQVAIRANNNSYGAETCVYDTDHFVFTSGTTTNRSNVNYLRPYYPSTGITDLSGKTYLNGQEDEGTLTLSVSSITLTVDDMASEASVIDTNADGEKGVWLYVCDSNLRNGQWGLVSANTATTITVTPNFVNTPEAGWYWFMGGIVPSWTKWFDFGSPQHKTKVRGMSITIDPSEGSSGNNIAIHNMQNLDTTIRESKVINLGDSADTVNTFDLHDRPATQHGFKLMRPSSVHDLKVEDITIFHRPRV